MAEAFDGRPCTWDIDGTIGASPAIGASASATLCALAMTTAVLGARQRLHAVVTGEAIRAAAELAIHACAVAAAHGRTWLRGVEHSNVVEALRRQLATAKGEHPATNEDSGMPFSCKPRHHVRRHLVPLHIYCV